MRLPSAVRAEVRSGGTHRRFRATEPAMPLDLTQTLSDLVALPSLNPMGRTVLTDDFLETRVTDYLQAFFARLGVPWERTVVEPSRDNIVARFEGDPTLPLLMYEAHQDTVPVDGMTIPPFVPTVRDGKLYGRGSCDIKGGMTAMLGALVRLHEDGPAGRPTVVMACTVNEENGFSGAKALVELWESGRSQVLPRKPDAAIVAEPTLLDVVVAHKGALRWRCRTTGVAAHSSQPDRGQNALYRMARVLVALERYQAEVAPTLPSHPLCGGVTLSVGTIHGGISVNTVPDDCSIEIDRRLIPDEDGHDAYREVRDYLTACPELDFPVIHDEPWMWGITLSDRRNRPLAERLAAVARGVCGKSEPIGVPYGTDAACIGRGGVPAVVFGPGSIAQAHTADEWLCLEQLQLASEILYRFAREFR